MSKSSLKLKYFEILNLNAYYQQVDDDILQEEEEIIDIIYDTCEENRFTFTFLVIMSKGSLLYLEYNTTNKKLTKIYKNNVISTIITNDILKCELSFNSPILLATSLNEIIVIDTKQRPCQIINLTEENMNLYSAYVDDLIVDLKFNCNQSIILCVSQKHILIYKLAYDKYEQKHLLQLFNEIKLTGISKEIDYSLSYETTIFPRFSDFNEDILYITYITDTQMVEKSSKISLENEDTNNQFLYVNIAKIVLNKKDFSFKIMVITVNIEKLYR
jgi:hypothetical protein